MKIKNVSEKIIHVGSEMLLPGKTTANDVSEAFCNSAGIKALVEKNMLEFVGKKTKESAKVDDKKEDKKDDKKDGKKGDAPDNQNPESDKK